MARRVKREGECEKGEVGEGKSGDMRERVSERGERRGDGKKIESSRGR